LQGLLPPRTDTGDFGTLYLVLIEKGRELDSALILAQLIKLFEPQIGYFV
jgi:hypothetical protein